MGGGKVGHVSLRYKVAPLTAVVAGRPIDM